MTALISLLYYCVFYILKSKIYREEKPCLHQLFQNICFSLCCLLLAAGCFVSGCLQVLFGHRLNVHTFNSFMTIHRRSGFLSAAAPKPVSLETNSWFLHHPSSLTGPWGRGCIRGGRSPPSLVLGRSSRTPGSDDDDDDEDEGDDCVYLSFSGHVSRRKSSTNPVWLW